MKVLFCLVLSLLAVSIYAQDFKLEDFKSMSIRNIGPAGMSGRVTAIDVDPSNTNRIFIGSASGGVWKSENGGSSWKAIFDDIPVQSIGALKINQKNPAEIWVGTGEGNPRNSHNSGAGVYKSIDGGKNWKYMGLKETKLIHRIIINEHNPDEVLVGALGSAWGPSQHRGVYRTVDGGKTWEKILYLNDETGVGDMVVDPNNPNKILAAMWEFGRKPWTFNSGGPGSGIHLTYDGGKTWKKLNSDDNGIPDKSLGRIGLAISPSKPNIIYALIESDENGLYKSENGGENWKLISTKDIGNRPFYYSEIYVDPSNENRIFNLWSYVSMSEDGGKTFKTIMDYGNNVHPDHHAFWISPDDPNYMIDGNDGGLNISRDGAKSWHFVSNLPLGQFYHISVDNDFPYNVYGGLQDNGSWYGPAFVLKRGSIRNYDWSEVYFGDGFDVQSRRDDSRFGYAMSQGGNLSTYDKVTGRTQFIKPTHPDAKPLRFNWNAALALDPFNDCGLYYGSQYVHYSSDCGQSWKILSPDLSTNDTTKQKQYLSGGLTIDDTQAENNTSILSIAPSPLDENIVWVGTDDGNIQMTSDRGQNWTLINKRIRSLPKGAFIPQIHPSNHNANEAFVVANNYRMNDWSAHLYHTTDGGRSFKRIVDDNNVKGFVNAIVQDPIEENLLFLGTDVGLYVSFNKGSSWEHWTEQLPPVQIRDMVIQENFSDLAIGTFGRSIWILDDLEVLRQLASSNLSQLKESFKVFDPPIAYKTSKRSYDGIRFIAQSEFLGENTFKSAYFPVWLKPRDKMVIKPDEKQTEEEKEDMKKNSKELKVSILNLDGDSIRNFTHTLSNGYNIVKWGMDATGERWPRRSKSKAKSEPGGTPIMHGTYKAVFTLGDIKDSCNIIIRKDPRSGLTDEQMQQIIDTRKEYNAELKKATTAFNHLQSARKSIDAVKASMQFQPDSLAKEIKLSHKHLLSQIDSLELEYMQPEGIKGYRNSSDKLVSMLRSASSYLRSAHGLPNANASNSINKAKDKMFEVVNGVNKFLNGPWADYQDLINNLPPKYFEELELIELKK